MGGEVKIRPGNHFLHFNLDFFPLVLGVFLICPCGPVADIAVISITAFVFVPFVLAFVFVPFVLAFVFVPFVLCALCGTLPNTGTILKKMGTSG